MKNFLNFRTLLCVLVLTGLVAVSAQAQGPRLRVEISIKDGKNTVVSKPINFSVSYSTPVKLTPEQIAEGVELTKPFYVVLSYEGLDLPMVKAFAQTKECLNADVIVTDTYGRLPTRKFELKGMSLEGLNEQNGGEYSNSYINFSCDVVVLDGIKLPN
ncbi:hypothetical protein [Flavobacterium sp. HSC-61S13]|uniref:hypothetical protein n=1 Tax=Flavobacterium sp. HSC-61S13 TaxID=2910963 RepID=UPI00209E0AE8|nr:hypothetical protein [Flavobacterium sp. HSC-61S13]MCP1996287.1 hypothetical protein [Flavobacterium sp. HSC-61S13]